LARAFVGSLFVRNDYNFFVVDSIGLSHSSVEILGIFLSCSLDSPVVILNVYRHPNSQTPFSFFLNLFSFFSSYKYAVMVGDFNAHHSAWNSNKQDRSSEYIFRNFESTNLIILNRSCTYISPPGSSNSIIDLSFATCELAILCEAVTESDSYHFPINISINVTDLPLDFQL